MTQVELFNTRNPIHAIILDKDNCEIKTLERFGILIEFSKLLADHFGFEPEKIKDCIRKAHAEIRFHDSVGLLHDITKELHGAFDRRDNADIILNKLQCDIATEWAGATEYYPGIIPALRHWQKKGTLVITHTDCEAIPFISNVYHAARDAILNGDIQRNRCAISFYDAVSCTRGLLPANDTPRERVDYIEYYAQTYGVPHKFIDKFLRHKNFIIKDGDYKPSPDSTAELLKQFDVDPAKTLYIGDSDKDGIEAHKLKIDFAWAAYGADLPEDLIAFCKEVASKNYGYGLKSIDETLKNEQVPVAVQLNDSSHLIRDLGQHYSFERHPLKAQGSRR